MGREIKRVPLDFDFPLGSSYVDHEYDKHCESCSKEDHDECDVSHDVPTGDGWQLWQTVSDGPVSPVFATPEELVDWMSQPVPVKDRPHYDRSPYPERPWAQGWLRTVAEKFVEAAKRGQGWMPSMVIHGGRVLSTEEMIPTPTSSEEGSVKR